MILLRKPVNTHSAHLVTFFQSGMTSQPHAIKSFDQHTVGPLQNAKLHFSEMFDSLPIRRRVTCHKIFDKPSSLCNSAGIYMTVNLATGFPKGKATNLFFIDICKTKVALWLQKSLRNFAGAISTASCNIHFCPTVQMEKRTLYPSTDKHNDYIRQKTWASHYYGQRITWAKVPSQFKWI